jgi:hypothetical protein
LKLLLHCAIKHSDTLVVCFYFCQNFKIRRIVFFSFIIFKYFCWELREIKKGQRENRGKHSRRVLWWNGKRNQINSSRLITVYIVQLVTQIITPLHNTSLSLSLSLYSCFSPAKLIYICLSLSLSLSLRGEFLCLPFYFKISFFFFLLLVSLPPLSFY